MTTTTLNSKVGDKVLIGGHEGIVTKVQDFGAIVMVSAAGWMPGDEEDGEGSLLIDVIEK